MLSLPVIAQLLSKEGQSRFSGVSIFSDPGPLSYVLEARRTSSRPETLITKIKYNRYTAYTGYFLKNYFSHFSPYFLFVNGDTIDRSRVPGFGQSYLFLAPFFYLGIILLFKQRSFVTLAWLAIAPIAAALTYQSPHALRAANMAIPLTIVTSAGIFYIPQSIPVSLILSHSSLFLYTLSFIFYLTLILLLIPVIIPSPGNPVSQNSPNIYPKIN
jgi:hypothetical protein